MLIRIPFGSKQPPKWCKILPETSIKAPCRPHRPPEWLILSYSLLQAGSDQVHPLTQLALQPVEQRNAATSSLCDIPHTIMYGLSAASHARKLKNAANFPALSASCCLMCSAGGRRGCYPQPGSSWSAGAPPLSRCFNGRVAPSWKHVLHAPRERNAVMCQATRSPGKFRSRLG